MESSFLFAPFFSVPFPLFSVDTRVANWRASFKASPCSPLSLHIRTHFLAPRLSRFPIQQWEIWWFRLIDRPDKFMVNQANLKMISTSHCILIAEKLIWFPFVLIWLSSLLSPIPFGYVCNRGQGSHASQRERACQPVWERERGKRQKSESASPSNLCHEWLRKKLREIFFSCFN